jgi:K+/H+ antiporter YhaU regulatory subunit KhtT
MTNYVIIQKFTQKDPKKEKKKKVLHNDKYHDTKITGNDAKEEQTVVESREEDSQQGAARVCKSR